MRNPNLIFLCPILATLLLGCGTAPRPPATTTNDGVALAVVFTGNWYWVGNTDYETVEDDREPGAFHALATAIDEAATELPARSELAIVAYGSMRADTRILRPLGPPGAHPSAALGQQIDYRDNLGGDLVRGVQVGIDELSRSAAPRRVLVVIGDGNDADGDNGPAWLAELRRTAEEHRVAIHGIVLPIEAQRGHMLDALTTRVTRLVRPIDLSTTLRAIARDLNRRRASLDRTANVHRAPAPAR